MRICSEVRTSQQQTCCRNSRFLRGAYIAAYQITDNYLTKHAKNSNETATDDLDKYSATTLDIQKTNWTSDVFLNDQDFFGRPPF